MPRESAMCFLLFPPCFAVITILGVLYKKDYSIWGVYIRVTLFRETTILCLVEGTSSGPQNRAGVYLGFYSR